MADCLIPSQQLQLAQAHDQKTIGVQYLVTLVVLFLLAGLLATLLRVELMDPGQDIMSAVAPSCAGPWGTH